MCTKITTPILSEARLKLASLICDPATSSRYIQEAFESAVQVLIITGQISLNKKNIKKFGLKFHLLQFKLLETYTFPNAAKKY